MEMYMRFPEWRKKALTLSYDDNGEQNEKLVEILNRYGVRCTFNLNSGLFSEEGAPVNKDLLYRPMTAARWVRLLADTPHEVAVHGLTHPHLEEMSFSSAAYELIADRANLERLFGRVIRGMAYPYGTYNDETVAAAKAAGVVYSRTVEYTEKYDLPNDWLRLKATCHHNHPRLKEFAENFKNKPVWDNAQLFYLWGHAFEFERDDNWNVIEDFCRTLSGNEEIWYATNIEVYDCVKAYRRLQFGTDSSVAHNPSALPVWLEVDGRKIKIESGETKRLRD
ncbi:MAG: polysaccharide deacetylase [Bacillota bacterium]|nr:MAG: polysaccharide deacetylase [Bacillota bacterium]